MLGKSKSQQLQTTTMTTSRAVPVVRGPSPAAIDGWGPANSAADHRTTTIGGDNAVDRAFKGTYQTTDQKTQEKLTLFRDIVRRIDGYMKRKHLRVIDLFRFCDADGNGSISPQEMIDTLSQMEIQLSPEQAQDFINYIDKDGNGSIDIDEFEELVRVARRNEAQREQLRKELSHAKRAAPVESKPSGKFSVIAKHRQRICDEFKSADASEVGALSISQLRSILLRLDLPGVDEGLVDSLIERALGVGISASSAATSQLSSSSASHTMPSSSTTSSVMTPSAPPAVATSSSSAATAVTASNGMVYLHQFCKSLEDLEWGKKANRFLDQSWLSQFDSQMERAIREFELL